MSDIRSNTNEKVAGPANVCLAGPTVNDNTASQSQGASELAGQTPQYVRYRRLYRSKAKKSQTGA